MRNVSAHIANNVLWSFVALNKKFDSLHEALVMELHQIFKLLHFFGYIFGKELWKWGLIVAVLLVLNDNQIAMLLQILDFSTD